MIGVTLGAQSGQGFIPTFIGTVTTLFAPYCAPTTSLAIVFHQLFEGLGLGARIATLVYPKGRTLKKWLMCLAYALVTPIGIAIVSPSKTGRECPSLSLRESVFAKATISMERHLCWSLASLILFLRESSCTVRDFPPFIALIYRTNTTSSAGIAQLLAMEWVNGDMRNAPLKEVVIALASLLLGLFAMSVIGKWA